MKLSPLALVLGVVAFARAQSLSEDSASDKPPTTFNDIDVPPLLELTPSNWDDEVNQTRWLMVKLFSPYCPHCIDYAPTYQTLYEYYFTSKPAIAGARDASFTKFYDFRFASINCVAYYDMCVERDVKTYPMTILYDRGEATESMRGVKEMDTLSEVIEEALEKTAPGSRPKSLLLPEPGDSTSPEPQDSSESASTISEKSDDAEADDGVVERYTGAVEKSKASAKTSEDDSTASSRKKFGSDWKVPTPGEVSKDKKPKKPLMTPNPQGASIALTAESFQKLVTMTQDPWFIKFYAPWCPHCKSMAPTWEQLAKNMKGNLNIGEVNCDREVRLCKDVKARSFPTILFFKGGERAEYQGLRGLGDFVEYADKALDLARGVPDVNAEELAALEQKEEVVFVYFYDHATTEEDFEALERLPLSLVGHAKLVKTSDPELFDRFKITTWPRLMVSREGRPTYYPPLTPNEMRDVHQVLDWMRSVWLPLVPELTASNARQIMDRKIVVVGVLNREDQDSFQSGLRELKSASNEWMDRRLQEFQLERKKLRDAKQMRIEEAEDRDDQRALRAAKAIRIDMDTASRKEVGFAWVDGVFWQRWIRTTYGIDVKDGERVIINDEDARRYWDKTVTGNYILVSRTSIMETLDKVVNGPQVIKPKFTISAFEKVFFDIRVNFVEHPYLSFGCVAGIAFGVVSWLRGRSRRLPRGHFRLDDTMGIRELKEGLLGQNGNAKAD